MKMQFINSRSLAAAGWSLCLAACLSLSAARADQWDKKTILTVNEKIQVTDRVLEPGTYVFKLLDTNADRHVVQIFNADQSHIIDTVLAIPNYRLEPTGKSQFRFYETPTGYAKALRAWFYPGDNFGQEFVYPKHLTMLAMASTSTTTTTMVTPPPAPFVAPEPEPQPEAVAPPPPPEPAPAEMAQNSPPPAPAEPAPQPPSLPKTASPYPLVGLGGLLFIGAFGMLRLKRSV